MSREEEGWTDENRCVRWQNRTLKRHRQAEQHKLHRWCGRSKGVEVTTVGASNG